MIIERKTSDCEVEIAAASKKDILYGTIHGHKLIIKPT